MIKTHYQQYYHTLRNVIFFGRDLKSALLPQVSSIQTFSEFHCKTACIQYRYDLLILSFYNNQQLNQFIVLTRKSPKNFWYFIFFSVRNHLEDRRRLPQANIIQIPVSFSVSKCFRCFVLCAHADTAKQPTCDFLLEKCTNLNCVGSWKHFSRAFFPTFVWSSNSDSV